jgi:DnaJ-domain-containing protein 1
VDRIFERLGKLLQSVLSGDSDERDGLDSRGFFGDPDLDDAMAELDADLARDQEERERLERRRREDEARRARESGSAPRQAGPPSRIVDDYRYLGLEFGAPLSEVKAAYKRLLHKHHPDRHNDNPENQRKATDVSARINAAYGRIEHWLATGKVPAE